MPNLIQKIQSFPVSPGVYIFKDKTGKFLYVGKATSLRDRVGSYFKEGLKPPSGSSLSHSVASFARPIEMMIGKVVDIEIKKTDTVLEAYILEQELIKKIQPKYNVDGKDDKSFSYVLLTEEEFPKWVIVRGTDLNKTQNAKFKTQNCNSKFKIQKLLKIKSRQSGIELKISKIYGPYISKKQIEIALKILRKIFPYHNKIQKSEKGCLDFQLGLCPGPYAGAISKLEYAKNIRGIRMILEGKKKNLLNRLKKEMEEYSKKQEFEKAADARNKIFALQHIQDIALIASDGEKFNPAKAGQNSKLFRIEGYDISNISGKFAVGSMVVFDNSNGEMEPNKSQYRKFRIKTIDGSDDVGSMEEVLTRRLKNSWPLPSLILLDGGAGHLNAARKVLRNHKIEIPLLAVAKGPTRKKLDQRTFGNTPELPERLILQIRDEAHRFAIKYHRKIRDRLE